MILIILSSVVLQQYINAYSQDLKARFCAKFGFLVTVLTNVLVVNISCLFLALFLTMSQTYDAIAMWISFGLIMFGFIVAMALCYYITMWNSSTYVEQMNIDLQLINEGEP